MEIKRRLVFTLIAGLALVSTSPMRAQLCQLKMNVSYTPVEELRISDIDIKHFTSNTLLFSLTIVNNNGAPAKARLNGQLTIALASGAVYQDAVTFNSDPFDVPVGGRLISNLNLGNNGDIALTDFHIDNRVKDNVQEIALSTGIYPSGVYTLNLQLVPEGCAASDQGVIQFNLRNPSRVELYSPRDGEVTSPFPLFEFYQEGARALLTVAEKPSDFSREEAITRKPPAVEVTLNGQNNYLYSGGRPLEDGKTYVWQVKSLTLGSGGDEIALAGPIGLFSVSNSAAGGETDLLLRQLEDLFGVRYPDIFSQIQGGSFSLTGQYMLDQSTISGNDLLQLLNEFRGHEDTVDLTLE